MYILLQYKRRDVICVRRLLKPWAPEHVCCPADAASGKPTTYNYICFIYIYITHIQLLKPNQDSEKADTRVLSLRSPPKLTVFIPCRRYWPWKADDEVSGLSGAQAKSEYLPRIFCFLIKYDQFLAPAEGRSSSKCIWTWLLPYSPNAAPLPVSYLGKKGDCRTKTLRH